jgi:glycosyltransferase involved in cell wall biosynthesis
VIVCNDSGAGEIIGTIGGGHIIPPDDEEALRGAIVSILGANELWQRRARSAADRARQRFGADIVCERLEAVYRDVLAQHTERARRSA